MAAHTVVGSSVVISGNVAGDGDVTVNGRLDGSVELMATLTIGPNAIVKADLTVSRAIIAGIVVGNITAKEAVELLAGARVVGDVITPRFAMADGALFKGAVRESGTHARPSSPPPLMPARSELVPPRAAATRVDLLRPASAPPPVRSEPPRLRDDVISRPPRTPSRPPEPAPAEEMQPAPPPRRRARAPAPGPRAPLRPPPAPPTVPDDDAPEPTVDTPEAPPPARAANASRPPMTPPEPRPLPGRGQKRKVVVKRR